MAQAANINFGVKQQKIEELLVLYIPRHICIVGRVVRWRYSRSAGCASSIAFIKSGKVDNSRAMELGM